MQINNDKIFSNWFKEVKQTGKQTVKESTQIYPKKIERDSVRLSEDALDINRFMDKLLSEKDEIRFEKVEEIEARITSGDYKITAKDVIDKLLEG